MLYDLPSKPICLEGYWNFLIFLKFFNLLTKTSKQHKGRLLVVVSFFIYFWRALSLSKASSGNDLSMPKFNFPKYKKKLKNLKKIKKSLEN